MPVIMEGRQEFEKKLSCYTGLESLRETTNLISGNLADMQRRTFVNFASFPCVEIFTRTENNA